MGIKILHLTDIHLGYDKDNHPTHYFCATDSLGEKHPNPAILSDLLTNRYKENDFDIIIDSGDLSYKGNSDEYKFSNEFYESLKNKFGKTPVIVVPGNHDINWANPKEKQQDDYIEFIKNFYGTDFHSFYPFFDENNRHSIVYYQKFVHYNLLIVGVNSAANLDKSSGIIYIDNEILNKIRKQIKDDKAESFCKIFVIHHHIFPFTEPNYEESDDLSKIKETIDTTLVVNSARIQSWLAENRFSLVLHGHRHQFHGRVDTLWHSALESYEENKLIVIGGGSLGVYKKEREHQLSFNEIYIHPSSTENYKIKIVVNEITEKATNYEIKENKSLTKTFFTSDKKASYYFESTNMVDCHEQISDEVPRNQRLYNFISVVHNPDYAFPSKSCTVEDRPATHEEIVRSFLSLHPEYSKSDRWNAPAKIKKSVKQRENNYTINHGSRIFGGNHLLEIPNSIKDPSEYFPINKVIKELTAKTGDSKGYISLFNYDIDVKYRSSALPGLMGIQFVRNDSKITNSPTIDLVAFFRTIELSFWWVVNMYELINILDYGWKEYRVSDDSAKKGSITFFATMAKWKAENLSVTVEPLIETKKTEDLYQLVNLLEKGDAGAINNLKILLIDFAASLSEINISFNNLEYFLYMVKGITVKTPLINSIINKIDEVCVILDKCIDTKTINDFKQLDQAKRLLQQLIDELV